MKAILGKKLGMTQVFTDDGLVIPVTVVEAGPMTVVRKKTVEVDGYNAVVCAFDQKKKNVTKPQKGIFDKAKVEAFKVLKEFDLDSNLEIGAVVKADIFNEKDKVDVVGISKGHGFSGVIKRWNNHRLKMTHGTGPVHREVGSLGANSSPSRVFKNKKMPGQYGNEKVTIQNLEVVKVDADRNLLLIKGNVPGAKGSLLTIKQSVKAK
ncbi:MAG: 50S ribosomal protein L3 [Clostridiales bacterium]|nr:50S ribosomal protein L3 [Clostridiales bacterium]